MLVKQLVPLAFGQGLDTKKDKKQQLFGKLRKAENVVFETLDSARKRNGYDRIVLQTTSNTSISTAQYLAKFKEELLLFDESRLYGFSDALQAMQEKGKIYSVFPTSWPVLNNSYSATELDMLVIEGLKVFTYRNVTTNEVRYSIQDQKTQTMIVTDALVATSARTPKLANIGNTVYFVYGTGAEIRAKGINILQPRTFIKNPLLPLQDYITVATNYSTVTPNIDVTTAPSPTPDRVIVAYCNTNPTQQLSLIYFRPNGTVSPAIDILGHNPTNGLDCFSDSQGHLVVSWNDTSYPRYLIYTNNLLGVIQPPTQLESSTISNLSKIAGIETGTDAYKFYYAASAAATYNHYIRQNTVTNLSTVGTASLFMRSVSLATKPFKVADKLYITVSYDSVAQPTYFVVDDTGVIVSKINPGVAGGHVAQGTLPEVFNVSSDIVIIPTLYRTKFVAANGEFNSLVGVINTELDFVVEDRYQNAALGNNLIIGGGVVQSYDGETVAEHGFNVFPEDPTGIEVGSGTPSNNSTLNMENGSYGYQIVYRWTDNQGQEHRSAPSAPISVSVTSVVSPAPSPTTFGISLTIPTLRLTQKSNVVIEVYRTEKNQSTVFYLANQLSYAPFMNNKAVDTVTFIDGLPDSALISGRTLYTVGGVLENIAAPSARVLATHTASNRIFLAGLENPNLLQYSKISLQGQPVEFNDALTIPVDPVGGDITALASMDEKLIVFETDAIFFISGQGPNNLGQQDTFTRPERISTDVGCLDPKSVVLTPEGLMFKSRKGIYLLSRALQLSYIGAPVEAFNSLTISSAKVVGELNQVRFTTLDGDCLVYNYVYQFWATFTNHRAKSAEVLGNDYYYLRTNNELYKENRQTFSDAGVPIKMRMEIGWISFSTLQGFGRVYKMLILGDWLSRHNLLVKVGYDFNEAWTQTATITPDSAEIDAVAYGDDSPYGEPTGKKYGGTGNPYQARVNFKQQKCQSIKLEIEDVQANAGEGFSLSQITFEVGGKSGLFKLGKSKKFAMS